MEKLACSVVGVWTEWSFIQACSSAGALHPQPIYRLICRLKPMSDTAVDLDIKKCEHASTCTCMTPNSIWVSHSVPKYTQLCIALLPMLSCERLTGDRSLTTYDTVHPLLSSGLACEANGTSHHLITSETSSHHSTQDGTRAEDWNLAALGWVVRWNY